MATFLISMIGFCAAWALIAIVLGLLLGSLFYNSDEGGEVRGERGYEILM